MVAISRRRALLMAAVSPVAMIQPLSASASASIERDDRPTFKRSDYRMVGTGKVGECRICNDIHYTMVDGKKVAPYTKQGHFIAWPIKVAEEFFDKNHIVYPVSDEAVPYDFMCSMIDKDGNMPCGMHIHNEFRWVD